MPLASLALGLMQRSGLRMARVNCNLFIFQFSHPHEYTFTYKGCDRPTHLHFDRSCTAKPKMAAVLMNSLARAFGNVLRKDFEKDTVEE